MLGGDGRKKNGGLVRELVAKLASLIPLRLNFATTFGSIPRKWSTCLLLRCAMRKWICAFVWRQQIGWSSVVTVNLQCKWPHNLRTTDRSRKSFALSKGRDNHIIVIVLVVWSSYAASMMHGAARAMGFQNAPRSSSQNLLICARYAPLWPG